MLWCQDAQNIGLSNSKLKSALTLHCIITDHNTCPSQTDRRTNIMTIARRFVVTNASRAKIFPGNWGLGPRPPAHGHNVRSAWYLSGCKSHCGHQMRDLSISVIR